jgi:hypothetical protein
VGFPVTLDKSVPTATSSPGLGDDELRANKLALQDLFGLPDATAISAAIMSMGSNVDGKLATAPVVKGSSPFHRLIGTEASAKDVRAVESGGLLLIQENTGSEGSPSWTTRFSFGISSTGDFTASGGDILWNSSTSFTGSLAHANSAARVYTFPDVTGTVALSTNNSGFVSGTRMLFDQDAAPTGWTRDTTINDKVVNIVSGSRVHPGSWTVSGLTSTANDHYHELPNGPAPSGNGCTILLADWPPGLSGETRTLYAPDGGTTPVSQTTFQSGLPINQGAGVAVSSAGTWRPAERDVIVAVKD